jgi:MFS family permease
MGSWFESRLRSLAREAGASLFCSVTPMDNETLGFDDKALETPGGAARPTDYRGPRAFRALRHRNYRLFFFGQMVSIIGTWMQTTALPLLIIKIAPQNPGLWLGMNSFLPLVPLVPLALVAGSLADQYPKRTIIVSTQTVMMLQAFALAALTWSGTVQMWQIMALTFVFGAATAIDVPARQAFVIEMVGDPDDLSSGIALNSAIFNLGRAIGPVIAGLLIAALDFGAAFLVNGLSFLAVIVGLLLMRLPPHPQQAHKPKMKSHLKEGLTYLWNNTTLLVLMSLVAVSAFLSIPFMTLMPIFAGTTLALSALPLVEAACSVMTCQNPEAVTYGLMMGVFGIGALGGALLAGTYGDRRRGKLLTVGNLFFPATLLAFAWSQSIWLSLLILLGVGVTFVLQNALTNTLVQVTSPDNMRGRIMSIYSMVFQGMMRAGGMQAGFMATIIGAPLAVATGALASLAYGLLVFFKWPQIRKMK